MNDPYVGPFKRFTLNGDEALEARLVRFCDRISAEVRGLVPQHKLEGLVLGGGYGRGQGGVLKAAAVDLPYNDFELYVFLRGNRILNEWRYGPDLRNLGERLSLPDAGSSLHVEFKIDSLPQFRRRAVSMFSYDLVAGHRILFGRGDLFEGCQHHLDAKQIPLSEATRLLFNRCTGLLLARERLRHSPFTDEDADFVGRNLAKAQLAVGDVVLTFFGRYHWSSPERGRRLRALLSTGMFDSLLLSIREQLLSHHTAGIDFKLHPRHVCKSAREFQEEHRKLSSLALGLWLWLEGRRLEQPFSSVREYASPTIQKYPETVHWRNCLLNLRTFGPKGALRSNRWRYPRERLLNTLPLLLWNPEFSVERSALQHLQKQLQTRASDWAELVAAYKRVWLAYG